MIYQRRLINVALRSVNFDWAGVGMESRLIHIIRACHDKAIAICPINSSLDAWKRRKALNLLGVSPILTRGALICLHRLSVRSTGFHPVERSSILRGDANLGNAVTRAS
jgi:hypothetical protein